MYVRHEEYIDPQKVTSVGENIKHHREINNISDVTLSDKLEKRGNYIFLFEDGYKDPTEEEIENIASSLNTTPSILLHHDETSSYKRIKTINYYKSYPLFLEFFWAFYWSFAVYMTITLYPEDSGIIVYHIVVIIISLFLSVYFLYFRKAHNYYDIDTKKEYEFLRNVYEAPKNRNITFNFICLLISGIISIPAVILHSIQTHEIIVTILSSILLIVYIAYLIIYLKEKNKSICTKKKLEISEYEEDNTLSILKPMIIISSITALLGYILIHKHGINVNNRVIFYSYIIILISFTRFSSLVISSKCQDNNKYTLREKNNKN